MKFNSNLLVVMMLGVCIKVFASSPVHNLENFLLSQSQNHLDETVISSQDVYSSRVRWAVDQAYLSQDEGNNELRDKFLSLALVYLEGDQFENFLSK